MTKQNGISILVFLIVLIVVVIGVISGANYYKRKSVEDAYAATLLDNQRRQREEAERAEAKAAEEAKKASEMEMATQQNAINLCHSAIVKRAKFESKAKVIKTEIRKETEKSKVGEDSMYVVTGKIDLMNSYGAMLPNNYICRVTLFGDAFIREPSVAGEDQGDNPEKVELDKALRTLGINPNDFR